MYFKLDVLGEYSRFFGQERSPVKNFTTEQIRHHCQLRSKEGDGAAIPRVAMRWTPAGKRKIGRPKLTWRRSVEKEMREVGWTWSQVQRWATDRQHFSSLVTALCAT